MKTLSFPAVKTVHKILLSYLALEVLLALVTWSWGGPQHAAPSSFADHLHLALSFTFDLIFLLNMIVLIWLINGFLNKYFRYPTSLLFNTACWLALGVAAFPFVFLCLLVCLR
ncbi:hypothetical protein GA0116948_109150 [Chitinophaga costaii]|uniref:Uncharacterized protein n=1 Tax=Chitinophaga costaii TaxID=1335309 RepID=A0A1C4ERS2_9BACT|nr:hypothetical protein [Chitinophaga costaii]PUZ22551.1 hypothetical protein DCM91_14890 [Chitinophaga costaii]SCC46325.1 hypothetical protein GA0116948_109150 [Chitinophaga costaii]